MRILLSAILLTTLVSGCFVRTRPIVVEPRRDHDGDHDRDHDHHDNGEHRGDRHNH